MAHPPADSPPREGEGEGECSPLLQRLLSAPGRLLAPPTLLLIDTLPALRLLPVGLSFTTQLRLYHRKLSLSDLLRHLQASEALRKLNGVETTNEPCVCPKEAVRG